MEFEVDVRLAFTTSNREPYKYAEIQVNDVKSGKRVLEVPLSPEQFYAIMSGGGTYRMGVTAMGLDPEHYKHVGKEHVVFSRRFEDIGGPRYPLKAHEVEEWKFWGEAMREAMDCHGVHWRDHNNGVSVFFDRYENDMAREEIDRLNAFLTNATPPPGLAEPTPPAPARKRVRK